MSSFFLYKIGRPIRWSEKRWRCKLGFHKYNFELENSLHNGHLGTRYHPCEYCYHACEFHEDRWFGEAMIKSLNQFIAKSKSDKSEGKSEGKSTIK